MAKAKNKKTKGKQKGAAASGGAGTLKSLTQSALVADIVAAALVSTAAAIKDSRKARRLAEQAGDELTALAQEGAEKGNAMWQLAVDIGRRAMDSLAGEAPSQAKGGKGGKAPKSAKSPKAPKAPKAAKKPKRNSPARKSN
jgi:hypothetical protein